MLIFIVCTLYTHKHTYIHTNYLNLKTISLNGIVDNSMLQVKIIRNERSNPLFR